MYINALPLLLLHVFLSCVYRVLMFLMCFLAPIISPIHVLYCTCTKKMKWQYRTIPKCSSREYNSQNSPRRRDEELTWRRFLAPRASRTRRHELKADHGGAEGRWQQLAWNTNGIILRGVARPAPTGRHGQYYEESVVVQPSRRVRSHRGGNSAAQRLREAQTLPPGTASIAANSWARAAAVSSFINNDSTVHLWMWLDSCMSHECVFLPLSRSFTQVSHAWSLLDRNAPIWSRWWKWWD